MSKDIEKVLKILIKYQNIEKTIKNIEKVGCRKSVPKCSLGKKNPLQEKVKKKVY